MASEVYFPVNGDAGPQDPRERTLMGSLKKMWGRFMGPSQPSPTIVYVQEEKVFSQPEGVRLPWFLPMEEYDSGTAETPIMRQMYRRALSFAPVKAAVLNKLFGVAALKLQIHPADKHNQMDKDNADLVRWNLVRRFRGGMSHFVWQVFAPAMADGYSVNEKIWHQQDRGKYAGKIALTNLKQKDVGWDIVPKTDAFNNVTSYLGLRYNGGREFHPADFVHYAHLPMYERPTGQSDYRAVYDAMWLYDTVWKLRRIQLTTKSFPVLWAAYEKESQQPGLNNALRRAKALSYMTVPKGTMINALDIAGSSDDVFGAAIQQLREEIVMGVNGAFLTQMAAGENVRRGDPAKHQSVTDLFKWFLSEAFCGYVLNDEERGTIKEIVDLNSVASEYPYASLDAVSWEEMKQLAEIVDKAKEWGLPISEEWAYEKFALEAPHDDIPGGDALGGNMGMGGPLQIGPDGQPLPPDPNAPPPPGDAAEPTPGGGTGGSPIDAEPHKAFAEGGGWEPAVRMGHRGGLKGGPARARALTPERRHEIAVQGGKARQAVKKHDEADQPVVTVETPQPSTAPPPGAVEPRKLAEGGGFDESAHPRDDHGRFIDKQEMQQALGDLNKAQELRRRVTKPEERQKLEQHLKGASWYGKQPASTPPNMGATKGEVKHPSERQPAAHPDEARLKAVRAMFQKGLDEAKQELASAFRYGRPDNVPGSAMSKGYDDRLAAVKDYEAKVRDIDDELAGKKPGAQPGPQQPAARPEALTPKPDSPPMKLTHTTDADLPGGVPQTPDWNGLVYFFPPGGEYGSYGGKRYESEVPSGMVLDASKPEVMAALEKELPEHERTLNGPRPSRKSAYEFAKKHGFAAVNLNGEIAMTPETAAKLGGRFAGGNAPAGTPKERPAEATKSGLPPRKGTKPSFATKEEYDKALETEYDKQTAGKQMDFKTTKKIVADIKKKMGPPPGEKAVKPAAPKPQPEPAAQQQPAVNLKDPQAFASAVHEAARSVPDAIGGHTNTGALRPSDSHKPLIADVYEAMKPQLGGASLDDFKQALLAAQQAGHLALERNDLPHNVADTPAGRGYERTARGEIEHGPATFHVLDTNSPRLRKHSEDS